MNERVEAAKMYARQGFSVIPVFKKKPMIKFADKPPLTVDEIEEFWKVHPYANVALKTDKFFVIDVDRHEGGEDGLKSILALNHNEWFESTLCQKTAGNGYQFFFNKKGLKLEQCIGILPGVDLKAHDNNYVVVAPSVRNEKKYEWLEERPIIKPPKGLIKFIKEKTKKSYVGLNREYTSNGNSRTATSELFETIVHGLGDTGGRNDKLASFAGGLLYRNVDPDTVHQLAKYANDNTPNPLPVKEVERTVESMINKDYRRRIKQDE